jgi:ADP-L-glycero-D-manno-heptose 6-epimerase
LVYKLGCKFKLKIFIFGTEFNMIVITGAAGFIGSCLASRLNRDGYVDLVLVDDFKKSYKEKNWQHLKYSELVERDNFFDWAKGKGNQIQFVFHIGARTDTTEFDVPTLRTLNVEYSKDMWNLCVQEGIALVYASSAATYGMGEFGFADDMESIHKLKPLNPYGQSKLDFDIWALEQKQAPYFWAGLKFFNVYGPNEYHKERMASVILHAVNQIKSSGGLKLFRSHKADVKDGEQRRDFVYVMDVLNVLEFLMNKRKGSGIYNLGSGTANTFKHLAESVFNAMDLEPNISYIDTPEDIREKYQYYTCADMKKLHDNGFDLPFTPLEEGVKTYVQDYLLTNTYY